MSGDWERTNRRNRLVHDVIDEVARTRRAVLPAALRAEVDAEFGDLHEFLRAVQLRWHRALDARLDQLLENGDADVAGAVRGMYRELARDLSGTRLLLDAHADDPALAELESRHRRSLTGTVGLDEAEFAAIA